MVPAPSAIMLDVELANELIRPHMIVVSSDNDEFATVDHVEGKSLIKLAKDESGTHHYIPLTWVMSVDERVHIDRRAEQARREWFDTDGRRHE
jgi:hypothetical protein